MPDAIITSTASTFGTISGTFAADQSTITGTVSGIVPGTLSGSVGVPGPAGSPGAPGAPGVGVPAGGTAGQYLQKIDGTNYNTDWVTLNLSAYALLSGASFSGFCDFINGLSSSGPVTLLDNGYLDASGLDSDSRRRIRFGSGNGGGSWGWGDFGFDGSNLRFGNDENLPETLATRSWVTAGFYPLTGNPSGFITSAALSGYAPLASPVFTGNPTAPTPATSDNDTSIATTAFVKAQGYLTSAPVTSVAGRTGAITLSNTDISGLGSLAVVNDAPSNGSQYARKNAAWDVVIPGDRYLTSSTTSNTVSNGNKTFTIGTGLSYTPTQNITISYDASNHMHGEVLTYNSGTGVLTVDINHHTGSGTYAAWVVNVGGVTPATSVAFADITGAVSSNANLQAALDLKANLASPTFTGTPLSTTAAVDTNTTQIATTAYVVGQGYLKSATASSTYAPLASPAFTGTPSLPTGTTAVTQTAGNNTTAVATTAFVTAANPDASTTVKGHVELATDLEVIEGTSTTTAIVPAHAGFFKADPRLRSLAALNQTAVSGSGAITGNSGFIFGREMYLNTLATGRAGYIYGIAGTVGFNASLANRNQIDFSKKVWMSGYVSFGATVGGTAYMGDANTMCRITLGGYSSATTGDMTLRGIGLKKVGGVGSVVTLTVHNGTGLTDVATTTTVADTAGINWVIYSDGTGNVTLYINGTQAATTTAGPTSATGSTAGCYREQVEATATPGVRQAMNVGAGGGWLYLEG